jgi:hypothetical protein
MSAKDFNFTPAQKKTVRDAIIEAGKNILALWQMLIEIVRKE